MLVMLLGVWRSLVSVQPIDCDMNLGSLAAVAAMVVLMVAVTVVAAVLMVAIVLDMKRWFHTACTPGSSRRATRLHGTLPVRIGVITMEREAVVGPKVCSEAPPRDCRHQCARGGRDGPPQPPQGGSSVVHVSR